MSDLTAYLAFVKEHSSFFINPPGAAYTILLDEREIRSVEEVVGKRLAAEGLSPQLAQVGIAYRDQYILLLRDAVLLPDGSVDILLRMVDESEGSCPGVITFPVYQHNVLLIRHFRHETRDWRLEIPGGFGMPGMSSAESAIRELEEEIGAQVARLVSLGRVYGDPGVQAGYTDLFYAELSAIGELETQEGILELLQVPIREFEQMIRANEINDAVVLTAYARARLQGLL